MKPYSQDAIETLELKYTAGCFFAIIAFIFLVVIASRLSPLASRLLLGRAIPGVSLGDKAVVVIWAIGGLLILPKLASWKRPLNRHIGR